MKRFDKCAGRGIWHAADAMAGHRSVEMSLADVPELGIVGSGRSAAKNVEAHCDPHRLCSRIADLATVDVESMTAMRR